MTPTICPKCQKKAKARRRELPGVSGCGRGRRTTPAGNLGPLPRSPPWSGGKVQVQLRGMQKALGEQITQGPVVRGMSVQGEPGTVRGAQESEENTVTLLNWNVARSLRIAAMC